MALYINTNMAAITSQNSLSKSQSQLATSLQRLSSGLRINSAADDAAGMAIASRMSAQINGLDQAARNANDGISLTQTASGAMTTISDNLQRMRSLSVQAANASATSSDRQSINNEIQQLSAEIQRVATTTNFNGTNLLDGSFTSQNFQVGANAGNTITVASVGNMQTSQLGTTGSGTGTYSASVTGSTSTLKALAAGDLTLNSTQVGASQAGLAAGQGSGSAYSIATAINAVSGTSGVTATANATTLTGAVQTAFVSIAANSFSINGISVGAVAAGGNAQGQGANVAAAINAVTTASGVTATADATTGAVTLTAADGRNISVTSLSPLVAGVPTGYTSLTTDTGFSATSSDIATAAAAAGNGAAGLITLAVNGGPAISSTANTNFTAAQNAKSFVDNFNAAAALSSNAATLGGIKASSDSNGVISLTNSGTQQNFTILDTSTGTSGFAVAQVGATVVYGSQHGSVTLNSSNASGIVQAGGASADAGFTGQVTTAATQTSNASTIAGISALTAAGASSALTTIDGALAIVNAAQAQLGALQNRFNSAVANMQTATQNLTAARSRIQDTDFAATTGNLTRAQILQQAGTAMLAQANAAPNGVMALLR